jgi:hypothetical protein
MYNFNLEALNIYLVSKSRIIYGAILGNKKLKCAAADLKTAIRPLKDSANPRPRLFK